MELRIASNEFERDFYRSRHCREVVSDALDTISDYWEANSRRRTGRMATDTRTMIGRDGRGVPEGVFEARAPYAIYQELGTRYIEGQHVLAEVLTLMRTGAL